LAHPVLGLYTVRVSIAVKSHMMTVKRFTR